MRLPYFDCMLEFVLIPELFIEILGNFIVLFLFVVLIFAGLGVGKPLIGFIEYMFAGLNVSLFLFFCFLSEAHEKKKKL